MNRIIKSTILLALCLIEGTNIYAQQGDLTAFGLKGNVQKVVYIGSDFFTYTVPDGPIDYMKATFNRDGKLTSINGELLSTIKRLRLERDSQGKISKVVTVDHIESAHEKVVSIGTYVFTYNANGRIKYFDYNMDNDNGIKEHSRTVNSYDGQGRLTSFSETYDHYAQYGIEPTVYKYSNYQVDSHGNWIKCIRTFGSMRETITRKITYYE